MLDTPTQLEPLFTAENPFIRGIANLIVLSLVVARAPGVPHGYSNSPPCGAAGFGGSVSPRCA